MTTSWQHLPSKNTKYRHFFPLAIWPDEKTQILFAKYAHYLPEIGPTKKLKNKKEMWLQISLEISGKSPKQCEERYKTVTKRKKSSAAHKVGAKKKKTEPDDSIDVEVEEVRKSVREEYYMKFDKSKTKTVQDTLLEIAQKREQAWERRHREKMDAIGKIHKLLAKMVQTKGK
ncbi:unnamed protein product [Ceratitis capitata]|uniref:(Mediterranean fruit fly) hypothetical protein n=2 Tax=Ceratitis capitata TaxID=7213 RepID=A0A811VD94_CERCA|nr:unnamed protein product [Ceratitis capitata]